MNSLKKAGLIDWSETVTLNKEFDAIWKRMMETADECYRRHKGDKIAMLKEVGVDAEEIETPFGSLIIIYRSTGVDD